MKKLLFRMPGFNDGTLFLSVMGKFGYRDVQEPVNPRVTMDGLRVDDSEVPECQKVAEELGVELLLEGNKAIFIAGPDWVAEWVTNPISLKRWLLTKKGNLKMGAFRKLPTEEQRAIISHNPWLITS